MNLVPVAYKSIRLTVVELFGLTNCYPFRLTTVRRKFNNCQMIKFKYNEY